MCPYIITTSEPFNAAVHTKRPAFTRRAVATLKDMRQDARNIVEDHAQAPGWTPEYIAAREIARDLPESGGTIGPLPDGTVIEVERVSYYELYDRITGRKPRTVGPAVIDAYNAREQRAVA